MKGFVNFVDYVWEVDFDNDMLMFLGGVFVFFLEEVLDEYLIVFVFILGGLFNVDFLILKVLFFFFSSFFKKFFVEMVFDMLCCDMFGVCVFVW